MLQRIRDKSSGPVAYAIVGLIALVFSVWGVGSYFTESADPVVAEVGDTEITRFELQRAYDQRYNRMQQLLGDNFDHQSFDAGQFRRTVLSGLIDQALLTQYAERVGYRVSDADVLHALREEPRFRVDGQFSAQRYRTLLSQAGLSASAFEAGLRNDLALQQVRGSVRDTVFVGEREIARAFALQNQRRRAAYLLFEPKAYLDDVDVTAAEVEAYYEDNPNAFMREQRVKLDYVVLDRSALEVTEKPGEAELKALYEANKNARFKSPERRRIREIVVAIEGDGDAARQQIQDIASRLESEQASFAEIAAEQSEGSAGGKLKWIERGSQPAALEQAVSALEPGAVSAPIKTESSWHLVKLAEVEPARVKAFDDADVQAQLQTLYRDQQRRQRFREYSERLDALSFEAPESLQPIVDALGLKIRATDWLTRSGGDSGLAAEASVVQAAFSDSVLKDGLNSTPIALSDDRQAVVRVADSQAAQRQPLEQVRNQIRESLRQDKAAESARDAAWRALERARGGTDLAAIAKDSPARLKPAEWIERRDDQLAPALRAKLFTLPRPKATQANYGTVTTDGGVSALLALQEVETPEPDENQRARTAGSLRQRIAGTEFAAFKQSLRDDFDIQIYDQRLN